MDFKEKIIYILIGLLVFSNILWCVDRMYTTKKSYDYNYSTTNENKNINDNAKGDE